MPTTNSSSEGSELLGLPNGFDGQVLFDAGRQAFASWLQGSSQLAAELGNFARSRMQSDSETAMKLIDCRDMVGIFQCQCQAAEKAVQDYLDEAGRLTELTMELALSGQRSGIEPPAWVCEVLFSPMP
jgi:hypothetical protein